MDDFVMSGKRLSCTISELLSKTQDEHENANETPPPTTTNETLTSEKVTMSCNTNEERVDETESDGIRVKMEPLDIGTYENDDDPDDYYNHDNESMSSSSLSFRYPVRNSPSRYNHRLAATQSELSETSNEKTTKKGFLNLWRGDFIYILVKSN